MELLFTISGIINIVLSVLLWKKEKAIKKERDNPIRLGHHVIIRDLDEQYDYWVGLLVGYDSIGIPLVLNQKTKIVYATEYAIIVLHNKELVENLDEMPPLEQIDYLRPFNLNMFKTC